MDEDRQVSHNFLKTLMLCSLLNRYGIFCYAGALKEKAYQLLVFSADFLIQIKEVFPCMKVSQMQ
jgi:hypothetical protein